MERVDTEKYRKELWEKEYTSNMIVASTRGYNPSSSLRKYIKNHPNINKEQALDLGSGNGRNSIYLVKQGFKKVLGIELSSEAVKQADNKAQEENLKNKVSFINQSLSLQIPLEDNSCDLIIDMMTMHSLTKEARENMVREVKRVLKPSGHFLFFTMDLTGEFAKKQFKANPGPDKGSYRFEYEGSIITEKTFTKKELEEIFSPLKLTEFNSFKHTTKAFGELYARVYISGIITT